MSSQTALCTLVACLVVCLVRTCMGSRIPQTLCANRDAYSGECRYGTYVDACQKTVCLKGPGQRCGGRFGVMGQCAGGLDCQCERCVGCAVMPIGRIFNLNRVETCFPTDDTKVFCHDEYSYE